MESNGKAKGNGHGIAEIAGTETFALPGIDPKFNIPIGSNGTQQQDRRHAPGRIAKMFGLGVQTKLFEQHRDNGRQSESSMTTVALRGIFSEDENYVQRFNRVIGQGRECVR